LPGIGVFNDTTKTKSSQRIVSIPEDVSAILKQHKAEQAERRLFLGDYWIDSKKVFTKPNGDKMHPDTVSSAFKNFAIRSGYPNISLKSLRHTSATLLIADGMNIRTVANRLGHSKSTTTMNIYAHSIKTADERAAQSIQNILKRKA